MKKTLLLLTGLILIGILAACSTDDGVNLDDNYVTPDVILEDIENSETFAFVLVDKACGACQSFKANALGEFEESHPGEIRYVEVNGIQNRSEEREDFETLVGEHLDGQFNATPTTYFMVDGELNSIEVGAMGYDDLLLLYETHIE